MIFLLQFIVATCWGAESLWIDLHGSRNLSVPGLTRVAVGNGRIVKARSLPDGILLTGKKPGSTTIRAWARGKETVWRVHVVQTVPLVPVVGVQLEFVEWRGETGSRTGVRFPTRLGGDLSGVWSGPTGGGWRFNGNFQSPRVWVEAMVAQGRAKVVAEPSLFVKVGEEATFQAGGEFPVSTTQSSGGTIFTKVEWKSYGLSARVKPHTVDAIHLSTEVQLEVSEPLGQGEAGQPPALHRRKLSTHVLSEDGETVLLSVLQRHREEHHFEGLFGVSGIPILGPLFGLRSRQHLGNALLVSLTLTLSRGEAAPRGDWDRRWEDGTL